MLRSRVLLILALLLALLPIPVLRTLGQRTLSELREVDREQRATTARERFADQLGAQLRLATATQADLVLDDPSRIAVELDAGAYDDPAIIALRSHETTQQDAALGILDELAAAIRSRSQPDVRCLGLLLARRHLTEIGRADLADALLTQLRELDSQKLSAPARRHLECELAPPADRAQRLAEWLSEMESRATSLRELSHWLDALGAADPALRARAERVAKRPLWIAELRDALTRAELRGGEVALFTISVGSFAVAMDPPRARFLAPEELLALLATAGAQPTAGSEALALDDPIRANGLAAAPKWPPLVLPLESSTLAFGSDAEHHLDLLLVGYAALVIALGMLMLRAQRKTEALATLQSDLVAQITHELRTPLTVLRMYGESLASGRVAPEAQSEYVSTMSLEADRLGKLVDRVATAARGDRGPTPESEAIDIAPILADLATTYARALADLGGTFLAEVPQDEMLARIDGEDLRLALDVLLDNAVAYGRRENEPPHLEFRLRSQSDRITITIRDHGPGVAESERKRLFERFARLDSSRSSQRRGAGMGLYLARRIARSAAGDLVLEFPSDGGTRAVFTLPGIPR